MHQKLQITHQRVAPDDHPLLIFFAYEKLTAYVSQIPSIVGVSLVFLFAGTSHITSSTPGVVAERGRLRAIWPPSASRAAVFALRLHKWSEVQNYCSGLVLLYLV